MSSFYGQMRWDQFERFFYNFTLRNDEFASNNTFNENPSKVNEATIPANTLEYVQPNEDRATFQINAANHWLKISPLDSVGDEHTTFTGFSVFHNKPATTNLLKVTPLVVKQIPTGEDYVELKSGDSFTIYSLSFDKAGHFSESQSLTPTYFKLPSQTIRVNGVTDLILNTDAKFHFQNEEDELIELKVSSNQRVLTFSHKTYFSKNLDLNIGSFVFEGPASGIQFTTERVLQPGDFISTYQTVYDNAGHLTSLKKVYYQLPISETDSRLQKMEETIALLNATVTAMKGDVNSNSTSLLNQDGRLSRVETLLSDPSNKLQTSIKVLAASLPGYNSSYTYPIPEGMATISDYIKTYLEGYILQGFHARIAVIEQFLQRKYPGEFEAYS